MLVCSYWVLLLSFVVFCDAKSRNLNCIYANKNETQTAITYFRQVKVSGSAEADEYLKNLEETK